MEDSVSNFVLTASILSAIRVFRVVFDDLMEIERQLEIHREFSI